MIIYIRSKVIQDVTMVELQKEIQVQKRKDVLPHQPNNNKGWMWMSLYWTVGMIIGSYFDYIPSWTTSTIDTSKTFTYAHMFSLFSTCAIAIPRFLSLYSTHGRQRSITAAIIFAIINGISETMIYLAMYDLGSKWLSDLIFATGSSISVYLSPILGYITFSCFAGPIHAFFWMPHVFPLHFKKGADKTFYKRGLPELQLMSISWLVVYAVTNDITSVCILHMIFNFCGAYSMGLELPSIKTMKD